MAEPRRHHLLPQFYMRSFTDPKERLNVIPRLGAPGPTAPYVTKIVNVLVERDYYTLVDDTGEEHFIVEKTYAEIEGRAADALRVLLDEGVAAVTVEERAAWAEFMAVQVSRGRHFREMTKDWSDRLMKATLGVAAANAPDSYFEAMSAEAVGDEPLPEMTKERRQQLIDGEGFDVVPTQEHMIEMSLVAVEQLTSIFFQMSWKLLRFPDRWLITSDHPVAYWREPSPMNSFYGIGPITAREVRIPLSPNTALVLTHPHRIDEPEDEEIDMGRDVARCLNRDLLLWPASGQWLTSPESLEHPVPVGPKSWDREWPRPWLQGGVYT
ncbi:MAG: hypothetical protein JWP53_3158 [Conexibacter sp.]|jgi:hypothetical protein|nr:hypothetical protein [Conexibacter sp.]